MTDFTVVNLLVYFRPSYKKTDLRSSQARQRLKYESMLKKNSSPGGATDSGFEDDRDVDPDNAIELTGNVYKRIYMYKYKHILFFFNFSSSNSCGQWYPLFRTSDDSAAHEFQSGWIHNHLHSFVACAQ